MDLSMENMQAKLKEKAKDILEKREASVLIGWGSGWNPAKASPLFVRDASLVENLVQNAFCSNNLAVYLPRMMEKTAIVVRPCEMASAVALIAEGKIDRENVYMIGVNCGGMVDQSKLRSVVGQIDEAVKANFEGDLLVVEFDNGEAAKRILFSEIAFESCKSCKPDLSLADVVIGESEATATVISDEQSSVVPDDADAAWWRAFWVKEFDKCLRCYACREACPACYCRDNCAVQALRERWTGSTINPAEALMFHAQRALHVAGRCTECGACERACPVGIPLTLLHKQVGKAVRKLFDFNVGEKADLRPPLEVFQKEEL